MRALMEPVMVEIVDLIKQQEKDIAGKGGELRAILLVGGFGSNRYLLKKVQNCVKPELRHRVFQPPDAKLAIVKGAIIAAQEKELINLRIARRHYFIECTETPFKPGFHRRDYMEIGMDGVRACCNRTEVFVSKGQPLHDGDSVTLTLSRTPRVGESLRFEDVMYSSLKPICPGYITDPDADQLGTLVSDLTTIPKAGFMKCQNSSTGAQYYEIWFDVPFTLDGNDLVAELIFKGKTYGRQQVRFNGTTMKRKAGT
ncbi:hypothetical protein YB2330_003912 [Saitoella coloradoensis]